MSTDLYTTHFGFTERPFAVPPDPQFIFWSTQHQRAFTVMEYGVLSHGPLILLTGEVGTGKTTLLQALLSKLDTDVTVGLISNAQGGRGDLLRWIMNALDVEVGAQTDYVQMFQQLQDFVINEYAHGRRVVLIIDEAQNLDADVLEEIRMLTNMNSQKDLLLQIILVGQTELRDTITQPELRQFAQRVTATYHLRPMDVQTTRDYIRHRLTLVGGTGDEFTTPAADRIHAASRGIPRMINKICDVALVYAVSMDKHQVDLNIIHELLEDGIILMPSSEPLLLTKPINVRKLAI